MLILNTDLLQWLGCVTSVCGSLLLASKTKRSGWGFVLFLISNGFWAAYGIATHAPGLLVMQIVFTITSTVGIYRWLLAPQSL